MWDFYPAFYGLLIKEILRYFFNVGIHSKHAVLLFQPELYNDVFDDATDGQKGGGQGLTNKVSPRPSLSSDRREYMSLAAVPRLSRQSLDLQVPTALCHRAALILTQTAGCLACLVVVSSALRDREKTMLHFFQ